MQNDNLRVAVNVTNANSQALKARLIVTTLTGLTVTYDDTQFDLP